MFFFLGSQYTRRKKNHALNLGRGVRDGANTEEGSLFELYSKSKGWNGKLLSEPRQTEELTVCNGEKVVANHNSHRRPMQKEKWKHWGRSNSV